MKRILSISSFRRREMPGDHPTKNDILLNNFTEEYSLLWKLLKKDSPPDDPRQISFLIILTKIIITIKVTFLSSLRSTSPTWRIGRIHGSYSCHSHGEIILIIAFTVILQKGYLSTKLFKKDNLHSRAMNLGSSSQFKIIYLKFLALTPDGTTRVIF